MDLIEKKIRLGDIDTLALFGINDTNLQLIEAKFDSSIVVRGDAVIVRGESEEVRMIERLFSELTLSVQRKGRIVAEELSALLDVAAPGPPGQPISHNLFGEEEPNAVVLYGRKEVIRVRNRNQLTMYRKVQKNDLVFAIGPAGTGKTFLAVAIALAALRNNEVTRIVLSRPAVEAGEALGFLPGDLNEKVDPYLRPLMDAMGDMLSTDKLKSMSERKIVEVVPLAYMRGRTLSNSFIILDEAQNATKTQMKMFLTRIGKGSKVIVTGDDTQIDLPNKRDSGLAHVQRILKNINGIEFVYFDKGDVVRHKLVADIIDAYDKASAPETEVIAEHKQEG